jgi:DNA-binding transcriptional ArsR family regulator
MVICSYAHLRIKEYDHTNEFLERGTLTATRRFLLRIGGSTAGVVDLCPCKEIEDRERTDGGTGVSQPSISRHLKILRERGLVRGKRDGASIEYRLADHRLIEALDILCQVMRDQLQHRANISHSGDIEA